MHFYISISISLLLYIEGTESENINKLDYCSDLNCEDNLNARVCGIREEIGGYRLKFFENECELLKYGCENEEIKAYGIINLEYCHKALSKQDHQSNGTHIETIDGMDEPCVEYDCTYPSDAKRICGVAQEGTGFRVRLFLNKCQLIKFNCLTKSNFTVTDYHICNGVAVADDAQNNDLKLKPVNHRKKPNVIIVDANLFNVNNNINDTIDNFFAATHVFDLPVDEIEKHVNESARRLLVNVFGPRVIFKPWVTIPKNISEDYYHMPTLSSCFHKCPTKCPDTYAPVCGQPGMGAREPSLVFQNHCYMDAAQCKMKWEDKSPTAQSSAYIESSFMFCLGDAINTLFRFLPLVRTLQHMGRLKKKGYFRYKFRNMRFLNNQLLREPKLMGR